MIAIAIRTYFLQPFTIPTGSMQPTLNGILAGGAVIPAPVGAQVGILSATKLSNTIWLTG